MSSKDIEKKFVGQPIFKQLIDLLPKSKFAALAVKHQTDVSAPLKASFIRKFHILNLPIQYLKHESTRTDVYIGWAMAGVRITKNKIL